MCYAVAYADFYIELYIRSIINDLSFMSYILTNIYIREEPNNHSLDLDPVVWRWICVHLALCAFNVLSRIFNILRQIRILWTAYEISHKCWITSI
jgi:hypothetical protein